MKKYEKAEMEVITLCSDVIKTSGNGDDAITPKDISITNIGM